MTSKHLNCSFLLIFFIILTLDAYAGGDEGRLRKIILWEQSETGTAAIASDPYRFIANIRNSVTSHTGSVSLPDTATWSPNPITIVDPSQLIGAHFQYEASFSTLIDLNAAFPDGEYIFDITRTYSSATTEFSAPVSFTGTKSIPNGAPIIQNTTWNSGTLIIQPAAAQIYYTPAAGVGFSWELVGGGGSGGGAGSGAPGVLDLTGMLRFGQSYIGEFRYFVTDAATTIVDPNAPSGAYQASSTYSTILESVVRFELATPEAAADFNLLSATYSSGENSWDVLSLLESKYEPWNPDSLFWRMDEWELTLGNPTWQDGVLQISYTNADGEFSGEVPFYQNPWEHGIRDNNLILPNPFHIIPEPTTSVLLIASMVLLFCLHRRKANPKNARI